MSRLDLPDVTLCAAASTNIALTARTMRLSMGQCKFADAVLFSHAPVDGEWRSVKIEKLDRRGYQNFRKQSPPTVETPLCLFIEWDSYVTDARAWHPSFREYDFIGAKWPPGFPGVGKPNDFMNVGNSGFSLQSQKFNKAVENLTLDPGEYVDMALCKRHRPLLERDFGIRFAPEEVADLFSYELIVPHTPTFGFHGLGNMWRHADDSDVLGVVEAVDPYILRSNQFIFLILHYAANAQFDMIERLFATMRKHMDRDEAWAVFRSVVRPEHAESIFRACEQLVSRP